MSRQRQEVAMDQLAEDLRGEDPLGVVVRAQIHIENQLNLVLEKLLANPKALKPLNLDFFSTARIAGAAGLDENWVRVLNTFGNLRNEFAHNLSAKITENRANNLYGAFNAGGKQAIQNAYDRTRKKMPKKPQKRFKTLPPEERFIIMAVTIHAALIAIERQLEQR